MRTKVILVILSVVLLAGGVIIIKLSKKTSPTDDLQIHKQIHKKPYKNYSKKIVVSQQVKNEQVDENRDIIAESEPQTVSDKSPITPTQTISAPSLSQIRTLTDTSMEAIGGRYQGHQEIRDFQGHVIEYSLVYSIKDKAPDIEMDEIYDSIRIAKGKKNKGQQLLEEARVENDELKLKEAAKLLVQADKEIVKESEYVTLNISATTDLPPILSFHYGLPDSVIMLDSAIQIAQEESGEECILKEIRQQGVIGSIFVVETISGKTLYVDPRKKAVFTAVRELVVNDKKSHLSKSEQEERAKRIRNQWAEFLEQGFDPNMFTLDGLTDLSKFYDSNILPPKDVYDSSKNKEEEQ